MIQLFRLAILCVLMLDYGTAKDVISVNEAAHIHEIGKVKHFTSYDRMSIVLKTSGKFQQTLTCPNMETPKDIALQYTELYMKHKYFIDSRLDLISSSRKKRSILSFLVGPLISLAGIGLTEYQIHSINSHLKRTDKEVSEITSKLNSVVASQIIFEHKTIGILQNVTDMVYAQMNKETCYLNLALYLINLKLNLKSYYEIVDNLLFSVISGHNRILLNPNIIDAITVRKIVSLHPEFSKSVFAVKPGLLYSTSYITVVGVDESLTTFHLILEYPKLINQFSETLLEVNQVGLHRGDNICTYFDLPKNAIVIENGTFQMLDVKHCNNHNSMYFCTEHAFTNLDSCIQNDVFNCTHVHKRCFSEQDFIKTEKGILFRNNIPYSSYTRNIHEKMSAVGLSKYGIGYLSWNNITELQLDNIAIFAPGLYTQPIKIFNFSTNLSSNFVPTYSATKFTELFQDAMKRYDTDLNELMSNILENPSPSKLITHLLTGSAISLALIVLVVVIVVGCYYKNKLSHMYNTFLFGKTYSVVQDRNIKPGTHTSGPAISRSLEIDRHQTL